MKHCIYCNKINENRMYKYCRECYFSEVLPQKAPNKPIKQLSEKRKKRIRDNGEADMFREIRSEIEHNCEVCGKYIPEPKSFCFAHVAPKGTYPELRNKKENIKIVCSIICHQKLDKMFSWIRRQEFIKSL